MQREIKFRGWYEKSQSWVYFDLNVGFTEEGFKIYKELLIQKAIFYQFTGLKDKNGVEIYEGDIISFTEIDEDSAFGREETNIVEVKWIEEIAQYRAVFKNGRRTELHFVVQLPTVKECEVIGNIYQNPELLK